MSCLLTTNAGSSFTIYYNISFTCNRECGWWWRSDNLFPRCLSRADTPHHREDHHQHQPLLHRHHITAPRHSRLQQQRVWKIFYLNKNIYYWKVSVCKVKFLQYPSSVISSLLTFFSSFCVTPLVSSTGSKYEAILFCHISMIVNELYRFFIWLETIVFKPGVLHSKKEVNCCFTGPNFALNQEIELKYCSAIL